MKTIFIFGSCRVRAGNMHKYLKNYKLKSLRTHTHGSKEVAQIIKIKRGNLSVNEIPYYYLNDAGGDIINYYNNLDIDCDLFIIEISTLKEIKYKKYYYQHFSIGKYIGNGNRDQIDFSNFNISKQTKDSLLFDLRFIVKYLRKPILFVPHINTKIPNTNDYIEERALIEDCMIEISHEFKDVYVFSPGKLFANFIPFVKNNDKYDMNHYNEQAIEIVAAELGKIVAKILENNK